MFTLGPSLDFRYTAEGINKLSPRMLQHWVHPVCWLCTGPDFFTLAWAASNASLHDALREEPTRGRRPAEAQSGQVRSDPPEQRRERQKLSPCRTVRGKAPVMG